MKKIKILTKIKYKDNKIPNKFQIIILINKNKIKYKMNKILKL